MYCILRALVQGEDCDFRDDVESESELAVADATVNIEGDSVNDMVSSKNQA